uniref:ATP synthase F0 subunit 8 n=1 Tax=Araneus angulatus TaxID=1112382 RepID=A0A1L2C9T1_ARAAN|nr:ATP synthase F0 subunit 8 [Araneus angulatus]AMD83658.1 ATP synthase F0 subunit 8 [Araneus angulatus]
MPQLMPLKWIFSMFMIVIMLISMCMMYSEYMKISFFKKSNFNKSHLNIWCW